MFLLFLSRIYRLGVSGFALHKIPPKPIVLEKAPVSCLSAPWAGLQGIPLQQNRCLESSQPVFNLNTSGIQCWLWGCRYVYAESLLVRVVSLYRLPQQMQQV